MPPGSPDTFVSRCAPKSKAEGWPHGGRGCWGHLWFMAGAHLVPVLHRLAYMAIDTRFQF
eukprot:1394070-Prymnesium_polylepis.2